MNHIIKSSGIHAVTSYILTTNKATILSTLNIGGDNVGSGSGSGLTNLIYDNIIIYIFKFKHPEFIIYINNNVK